MSVVPAYGVREDARGLELRIVGFRGHCEDCGWLGEKQADYFTAMSDLQRHRGQREYPKAVPVCELTSTAGARPDASRMRAPAKEEA